MAFGDFTVVRSTPKRVLNSSGVLAEVAVNTPAFEFNADGTYRGLLVEPAGTNVALHSEDFSNAAWTKIRSSIVANDTTAPDGTATADRLVEDSSASTTHIIESALLSGSPDVFSIYAKAIEREWIALQVNDGLLSGFAYFNLSTGALGTTSSATSKITSLPNDWYRCEISVSGFGASAKGQLFLATGDGVASYTGDGTSGIFVWGAQLETGSVATSYIPTVASTVTRTADAISLSSASSLIGQTSGTIYMELDWRATTDAFQVLLNLSNGTPDNEIGLYRINSADELRMIIVSNAVVQTNQGAVSTAYDGVIKLALAYATNDAILYKDGASISTDTVIDLSALATLDEIKIGQGAVGTAQANMWIRSVALFPTRLTNSQLESLTTL